jgi:hypothetical protein
MEQSVGVALLLRSDDRRAGALLLRGDDRRAGALLLRGMLGRSSFAATSDERQRTGSRREQRQR